MGKRYYTPDISEFYVGFEYEEDDNNTNNWEHQIVGKDIVGDLDYFDDLIREGNIRVKHLDKEDLQKLGWEKTEGYSKPQCDFHHRKGLFLNIQGKFVSIFDFDFDTGKEYLFQGIIKNKSELKKLMKQLKLKK